MRSYSETEVLQAAERAGVVEADRLRLQNELRGVTQTHGSFEAAHIAYYFGALLICGAMGWFVTDAWDHLSGLTLFAIALLYAALFGGAAYVLSRRPGMLVPAGMLMTVAVCMTPLAVYGLERQIGWWPMNDPGGYSRFHPYINGSWVVMEAGTILAAAIALRLVRFPFLTAPAAYALWYLSMDLPRLFGASLSFHDLSWITVGFGVVMLAVAFFADGERDLDFAFWFYLFGLLCFTGGLMSLGEGKQSGLLLFGFIHACLVAVSLILQRRVFLVFGAIGIFVFLATEATRFFKDSLSFTVCLTVIGVLMIAAGMFYKKHEVEFAAALEEFVPHRVLHRHKGFAS